MRRGPDGNPTSQNEKDPAKFVCKLFIVLSQKELELYKNHEIRMKYNPCCTPRIHVFAESG